jgi:hypothetical protein
MTNPGQVPVPPRPEDLVRQITRQFCRYHLWSYPSDQRIEKMVNGLTEMPLAEPDRVVAC